MQTQEQMGIQRQKDRQAKDKPRRGKQYQRQTSRGTQTDIKIT